MIPFISAVAVALVATIATSIVLALRAAAGRAGLPADRVRGVALRTALVFGAWLALTAEAAASGVLANFEATPPRMLFVLTGSIAVFALLTRGRTFERVLDAMPRAWPVAIHTMRIPIEIGLWSLFLAGRLPIHLTLEGRNYDILVGLTAPLVALATARGWLGSRGLFAWNLASLGLLANILGMALTTIPGPLHLGWPGVPNVIVAEWPFVWLPAFLVPVALFGHVLSLRQLARGRGVHLPLRSLSASTNPEDAKSAQSQ